MMIAYLIKICFDIFQKNFPSVVWVLFFKFVEILKIDFFCRECTFSKFLFLNNVKHVKIYICTDFCLKILDIFYFF
jgi:hypothetical protein